MAAPDGWRAEPASPAEVAALELAWTGATVPLREDFRDIPWEILCLVGYGVPTG